MADKKLLSVQEVGKHNTPADLWLVVEGQVWDLTEFHEEHPGGSASKNNSHLFMEHRN
jgi:L-lactate dehydrogenase (cytochrome)